MIHPDYYVGLDTQMQAFAACKTTPGGKPPDKQTRFHACVMIVAEIYGISYDEIVSPPDRRMIFVEARSMVFFYLRVLNLTYKEIGRFFGRDHSSVIHNVKRMCYTLDRGNAPERAAFVQLLQTMGHIPMILVNTHAGSQYLHEIFDARKYSEFFDLNLAYFDQLAARIKRNKLKAAMTGVKYQPFKYRSFHSWILEEPLKGIYMKKPPPKSKKNAHS